MGEFVVFTIKSTLLLSFLFAAYKLTIGRAGQFGIRRATLLIIYLCAILIPFADSFPIGNADITTDNSASIYGVPAIATPTIDAPIETEPHQEYGLLLHILSMAIVAGVAVNILLSALGLIRIARYRTIGRMESIFGMKVAVIDNNSITPFTFGSTIYLSQQEYEEKDLMILTHEHCHKVKLHYLDLIAGRAIACLMWWNPFAWLMLRELHDVHEFQADEYVLSYGFDKKSYQYLLIKKAAGSRLQTFADSLNHSKLKKRLTMMKKSKKKGGLLSASLMIPAFVAGTLMMSDDSLAAMLEPLRNADIYLAADSDSNPATDSHSDSVSKVSELFSELQTPAPQPSNQATDAEEYSSKEEKPKVESQENKDSKEDTKPAIKIDGKLMPESFDMNSINPDDIQSITVLKDNEEEYPNGLISIELKKTADSNANSNAANAANSDEPLKVLGYGTTLKFDKEAEAKSIPNVYIVNHVDNMKGTNFTLTIVPGSGKEVEIKSIQIMLNGKTYDADSVSSSFSKSNDQSTQKVEIHLDKTFHKFDTNKDKIIVHTANATLELPILIL